MLSYLHRMFIISNERAMFTVTVWSHVSIEYIIYPIFITAIIMCPAYMNVTRSFDYYDFLINSAVFKALLPVLFLVKYVVQDIDTSCSLSQVRRLTITGLAKQQEWNK